MKKEALKENILTMESGTVMKDRGAAKQETEAGKELDDEALGEVTGGMDMGLKGQSDDRGGRKPTIKPVGAIPAEYGR